MQGGLGSECICLTNNNNPRWQPQECSKSPASFLCVDSLSKKVKNRLRFDYRVVAAVLDIFLSDYKCPRKHAFKQVCL